MIDSEYEDITPGLGRIIPLRRDILTTLQYQQEALVTRIAIRDNFPNWMAEGPGELDLLR